jgi:hypothetical protein
MLSKKHGGSMGHSRPTAKEISDALCGVRDWMRFRADEYQTGLCKHLQRIGEQMTDISTAEAADLRIYADQLDAFAKRLMENA